MNSLAVFFSSLWRLWFYIWMVIVILILSPFLLLTIWSDKTYSYFFKLARLWAILTFYGIGMRFHIEENHPIEKGKSYMLIANHTSMLDIMMMLILVKDNPFVFVGKAELSKLPIFGFFYKRTCILVDRKDARSKKKVFDSAQDRINKGLSICIFPEGGVNDDRTIILDSFKDGAFRLAIDHQIPIVPFAFGHLRHFFPFVWGIGHPGVVPVKVFPCIETKGLTLEHKKELKETAFDLLYKPVLNWENQYAKK
ncbi:MULTISPECIES: lysophospholipid acyltransferase family protein [Myroides]|uniref:1-acyl-sn-glycerol-3-phosphate acyltransferase n=1 Tax=Myroides albus TaxID=2562892 RepID=A0A6I3LHB7_9FLAO|nr:MULTISPECIES: lysophospholipid acyltransferase family protein [Myroides]MTG97898.1 1-acyl-sn-glycerol-3-phosphate acyltransferase [Myroides albus]MVX36562.1 1-acyl-sn-glycerol-3-phosphate acyltransferase [Myroides sp. LoEW2-1]UVD81086.1 1-acyl-sn-glycerol-3-phosphate acyltransferase [Myroides albus]